MEHRQINWKSIEHQSKINSIPPQNLSEIKKISTLEKATHNKNYSEKDLFEIYKQFQFNINDPWKIIPSEAKKNILFGNKYFNLIIEIFNL